MNTTVFRTGTSDDDQLNVEGIGPATLKVAMREARRQGKPLILVGWQTEERGRNNSELQLKDDGTPVLNFIPLDLSSLNRWSLIRK